jgi:hypothetical protein
VNKLILVPTIGTVAALIAIFVFHPEREQDKPQPARVPPPVEFEEPAPQPRPQPLPEPSEWFFNLEADGALTGADSGDRFASVAEALGAIAPEGAPRPKVVLGPGEGVTDEQLQQAVAALSERCDVRVFRRD